MPTSREQVNVRLDGEQIRVLQAVAFLHGTSVTDVVRGLVAAHVDRSMRDAEVSMALEARARYEARSDGTLTDIAGRTHEP